MRRDGQWPRVPAGVELHYLSRSFWVARSSRSRPRGAGQSPRVTHARARRTAARRSHTAHAPFVSSDVDDGHRVPRGARARGGDRPPRGVLRRPRRHPREQGRGPSHRRRDRAHPLALPRRRRVTRGIRVLRDRISCSLSRRRRAPCPDPRARITQRTGRRGRDARAHPLRIRAGHGQGVLRCAPRREQRVLLQGTCHHASRKLNWESARERREGPAVGPGAPVAKMP